MSQRTGATGWYRARLREALGLLYGTDCLRCGEAIDLALAHPDPRSASLDHLVEHANDGPDHASNLRLAHLICNSRAGGSMIAKARGGRPPRLRSTAAGEALF